MCHGQHYDQTTILHWDCFKVDKRAATNEMTAAIVLIRWYLFHGSSKSFLICESSNPLDSSILNAASFSFSGILKKIVVPSTPIAYTIAENNKQLNR